MTVRALVVGLGCLAFACANEPKSGGNGSGGSGGGSAGTSVASNAGSTSGGTTSRAFACDPTAKPPAASLRRLTMAQYKNTLADFVGFALGSPGDAASVLNELADPLSQLPVDHREPTSDDVHGSYRRLDQSLQQLHVDAFYDLGVATAARLTTPERLGTTVGACATDRDATNDEPCLQEMVARLGAHALRRPLDADEIAFYVGVYGSDKRPNAAAYADVLATLLNAPQLLYFVEHGQDSVAAHPGVFTLSSYELASRLAYQLWQGPPDVELLAHAADGSLLDSETYRAQVARLLQDVRARTALSEFFGDFAKVEDLPLLDAKNADPVFKAFAGPSLPSPALRQSMIDEVLDLFGYYTWQRPSSIAVLLQSDSSFARSTELAALYGIAPWNGTDAPPSFPAGQRPGPLTRALFLSTGTANTRPIMKGVFIRKHVLCDAIPPPPPGANAKPPELEPGMTTRETVEELTEKAGTICAGCHASLINALGFATENFDALGRYRSEQAFFDPSGAAVGSKAVDSRAIPHVDESAQEATGAADLMQQIVRSGKVEACLSRNFFRYTFARWEELQADGCTLERLRASLQGEGTLLDLVSAATLDDSFKQRAFE